MTSDYLPTTTDSQPEVTGNRIMVIMAHPDDGEFSSAGTLAKWIKRGKEVIYVVCTNGNKGSDDLQMTPQRLAQIRKEEQEEAARILGVKEVVFLGWEDGYLRPTLTLRRDISRAIRRYKPDVAMCPDPATFYTGQGYVNHPDHRATGEAALAAIFPAARDRLTFPELLVEGLEPHKVKELLMWGTLSPDKWFDITETIDIKLAALRAHRSQVSGKEFELHVRERSAMAGEGIGVKYAEAFRYIALPG
ncbi:MAG: PIG-L family deacetylase [Chloroflexi bacterium]|nr:PIG-L family deacetylase [Chloroflexota bacterium]